MKSLRELCEGSWGYEPNQNDGTLDLRITIWWEICEAVYDKCEKYTHYKKNFKDTDIASWAWEALGALEYFIDEFTKCEGFALGDQDYDRYHYWYQLNDKRHKNIFDLYEKCLLLCEKCPKWIEDWKDPEAMKQSLEHRHAILETWKRLYNQHLEHEAIVKRQWGLQQSVI